MDYNPQCHGSYLGFSGKESLYGTLLNVRKFEKEFLSQYLETRVQKVEALN